MCLLCESGANFVEDFIPVDEISDGILTVYIDRKGNYGAEKVAKKQSKHIRKAFRLAEQVIDKVTGNSFDIKFTKKHRQADIKARVYKPGHPEWGGWRGFWDKANGVLAWKTGRINSAINTTISHEIGHVFGLAHPVGFTSNSDSYPETVMAGSELLVDFTSGDLTTLRDGWLNTQPLLT